MTIIEPKECPDILEKLQIATQKSYWRDSVFRHRCVSHARIAPILGGSHPSLCLPRRRRSLIPPILLPRLNLSWYPLHLHRLEPAGVEWESRCWGDKSPQPSKAVQAKKRKKERKESPQTGGLFYFSVIPSPSPLGTPCAILLQSHKTNIWLQQSNSIRQAATAEML